MDIFPFELDRGFSVTQRFQKEIVGEADQSRQIYSLDTYIDISISGTLTQDNLEDRIQVKKFFMDKLGKTGTFFMVFESCIVKAATTEAEDKTTLKVKKLIGALKNYPEEVRGGLWLVNLEHPDQEPIRVVSIIPGSYEDDEDELLLEGTFPAHSETDRLRLALKGRFDMDTLTFRLNDYKLSECDIKFITSSEVTLPTQ